jgi:dihydrofolate synthase/folylpolyglutamate synthase
MGADSSRAGVPPAPDEAYYAALAALIQPRTATTLPDSLEPVRALLAALGVQQPPFPAVVVAGSTGKGTNALRLAAGLASGGLRVGLYTSPHLHSFRERFALLAPGFQPPLAAHLTLQAGLELALTTALITPAAFTTHAQAVARAASGLGFSPSTFESATALALRWFAAQGVDVAVCEIGLGGRFDAVNAVAHRLALIGPIELEHAAMLGGTLERIAWHKAGVIPPDGAAFVLRPESELVRAVFEREAQQAGAALTFTDDPAGAGLDWFRARGVVEPGAASAAGLALPGRLERVQAGAREVIIDGGHTPLAARRLAAALQPALAKGARVIVGMLTDKDASAYVRELDVPGVTLVLTRAPAERARAAAELAATVRAQHAQVQVEPSFDAALDTALHAPEGTLAVAGSLRMAAAAREALGLLDGAALDEARRTRALFEGPAYRAKWGG